MSETGWQSVRQQIERLESAEALQHLNFYVHKRDNRDVQICGREASFPGMTEAQANVIASEINEAIEKITSKHADVLRSNAANQLRRFL